MMVCVSCVEDSIAFDENLFDFNTRKTFRRVCISCSWPGIKGGGASRANVAGTAGGVAGPAVLRADGAEGDPEGGDAAAVAGPSLPIPSPLRRYVEFFCSRPALLSTSAYRCSACRMAPLSAVRCLSISHP